ncbi:hypothetical protein EON64_05310 [archaeon]|nr:MAG: hypothetical protein EON64_05310 [archaeon]
MMMIFTIKIRMKKSELTAQILQAPFCMDHPAWQLLAQLQPISVLLLLSLSEDRKTGLGFRQQ